MITLATGPSPRCSERSSIVPSACPGTSARSFFEEPLSETDQQRDQFRHSHAGFGRYRDDPDVPRKVAYPVVPFGRKTEPQEFFRHRVQTGIERPLELGSGSLEVRFEQCRPLRLAPAVDQVDLR